MKGRLLLWTVCIIASSTTFLFSQAPVRQFGQEGSSPRRAYVPITDALLENPNPNDWIHWRGTLRSWGYSPLKQINRDNVGQLRLAWMWALPPGPSEAGPLVYNGIMFIPLVNAGIDAVDAATGERVWTYKKDIEKQPPPPPGSWMPFGQMRSLALYDDKVYMTTHDAHIIALKALTGEVVWDTVVADYKLGYRYTSGPIAAKGKIVAGMTGCDYYKNDICFVSAYDAQTGKELWKTSTVARPGEPGGETWGNLPLTFRAGSDTWVPGSYDPATNLIYYNTSQAKPWARVSRGTDGDALYTNSTLALEPDTGRMRWYYQYVPGETHDLDEAFESVLVDHDGRTSLFRMGKHAILWEIDRTTGKFVAAHDLGYQDVINVDPVTGRVTYRPGKIPQAGVPISFCSAQKIWRAMAYSPETQALYAHMTPGCSTHIYTEVEKVAGGGGASVPPYAGDRTTGGSAHPQFPNRERGLMVALRVKDGKELWRTVQQAGFASSVLTTAGGLVVVGDSNGVLYLQDATTGRVLFQTRLAAKLDGTPISYAIRGKQYLAVPVGSRATAANSASLGVPSNAIAVFALPDKIGQGTR